MLIVKIIYHFLISYASNKTNYIFCWRIAGVGGFLLIKK